MVAYMKVKVPHHFQMCIKTITAELCLTSQTIAADFVRIFNLSWEKKLHLSDKLSHIVKLPVCGPYKWI